MAHRLIGTIVEFTRPVIVKAGYRRMNEEKNEPEEIAAKIEMQTVPAFIIGVEPTTEGFPRVHLAFMDPTQLHHIGGSGWRDAFSRVDSVRPETHPDVEENEHIPYYVSEEIYRCRQLGVEVGADCLARGIALAATSLPDDPNGPLPPPNGTADDDGATAVVQGQPSGPPAASVAGETAAPPAPATGRQRRKPGEPA